MSARMLRLGPMLPRIIDACPWHHMAATRPLSRRQLLQLVRCLASGATAPDAVGSTGTYTNAGEGYTAGDAPDMRKNPLLYQALNTAEATAPSQSQAAAAEPAVSVMLSAHAPSQPPTTSAAAARGLVKPEILSPVGGWPQLRAAVENGADSVYFGLTDFNARARASNFTPEELPEVMTYLHDRGVKGFVTFNILVFDEELTAVEERIRQIAVAGVDAVIVQDLAVVELVRRVAPGLPVHGSTQMSITSAEGAEFAATLGVDRVVVGRELSIKEIAKVRSGSAPEVEAFVHGALCVSYSGQCFSSEAWGGRSANRGQCAQACRMPYALIVDGGVRDLADAKYLLSPQDLAAVDQVPELILAGVSCFKIEGRLKGPEYVALTTQVYRNAVDAAWAALTGNTTTSSSNGRSTSRGVGQQPLAAGQGGAGASIQGTTAGSAAFQAAKAAVVLSDQQRWDLEQVFARGQDRDHRGLTPGFLEGVAHQRLVRGRAPRHRGVYAGTVVRVVEAGGAPQQQQYGYSQRDTSRGPTAGQRRGGGNMQRGRESPTGGGGSSGGSSGGGGGSVTVLLELVAPLKRGDGLVFDAGHPEDKEEGGSVYELLNEHGRPVPGGAINPSATGTTSNQGGGVTGRQQLQQQAVAVDQSTTLVAVVFGQGQVDARRIQPGQLVWRTKDATLESRLASSWDTLPAAEMRRAGVTGAVRGTLGGPLTVVLRDEHNREAVGVSSTPLAAATSRALTEVDVSKAVGAVGGDGLRLVAPLDLTGLRLDQGLFMPVGELKAARRAAAEALVAARRQHTRAVGLAPDPVLPALLQQIAARQPAAPSPSAPAVGGDSAVQTEGTGLSLVAGEQDEQGDGDVGAGAGAGVTRAAKGSRGWVVAAGREASLRVLCRSAAQVTAALEVPWLREVVVDFLEVQGLKEAVAAVRAAGRRVTVATPRVLKPDEERLVHFYLRLRADTLLVRSAGLLHQLVSMGGPGCTHHGLTDPSGAPLAIPALEGDFSLNAANAVTADLLITRGQLTRLAPTHDLSAMQICGLSRALGASSSQLEVTLHHHLPIFHTEHCVFARFLSDGNSYKDCGHPCERHHVHLRDGKGADHLLLADMGCRNTLFNAEAQSGVFFLPDFLRSGVRHFRVELVDQPPEVVAPLLQGYRDVLDGKSAPGELWSWLRSLPDANGRSHGVTPGSLGGLAATGDRSVFKPTAASIKQQQKAGSGSR